MLQEQDYKILKFLNSKKYATVKQIAYYVDSDVEVTLFRLSSLNTPNGSLVRVTNVYTPGEKRYVITNLGKKVLEDYNLQVEREANEKRKQLLFFIIPIIISVIALLKS